MAKEIKVPQSIENDIKRLQAVAERDRVFSSSEFMFYVGKIEEVKKNPTRFTEAQAGSFFEAIAEMAKQQPDKAKAAGTHEKKGYFDPSVDSAHYNPRFAPPSNYGRETVTKGGIILPPGVADRMAADEKLKSFDGSNGGYTPNKKEEWVKQLVQVRTHMRDTAPYKDWTPAEIEKEIDRLQREHADIYAGYNGPDASREFKGAETLGLLEAAWAARDAAKTNDGVRKSADAKQPAAKKSAKGFGFGLFDRDRGRKDMRGVEDAVTETYGFGVNDPEPSAPTEKDEKKKKFWNRLKKAALVIGGLCAVVGASMGIQQCLNQTTQDVIGDIEPEITPDYSPVHLHHFDQISETGRDGGRLIDADMWGTLNEDFTIDKVYLTDSDTIPAKGSAAEFKMIETSHRIGGAWAEGRQGVPPAEFKHVGSATKIMQDETAGWNAGVATLNAQHDKGLISDAEYIGEMQILRDARGPERINSTILENSLPSNSK